MAYNNKGLFLYHNVCPWRFGWVLLLMIDIKSSGDDATSFSWSLGLGKIIRGFALWPLKLLLEMMHITSAHITLKISHMTMVAFRGGWEVQSYQLPWRSNQQYLVNNTSIYHTWQRLFGKNSAKYLIQMLSGGRGEVWGSAQLRT